MKSKKNIIKAFGASSFGSVVGLINQVLLVPLFISSWGVHLYGEWLILSSIPAIIATSGDLGFATVAANEASMKMSSGNKKGVLQTFQSTWIFVSAISLFLLFVFFISIDFFSFKNFLKLSLISNHELNLIILFLLLKIFLTQQFYLMISIFRLEGRYAQGLLIDNCIRLVEVMTVGLLLFFSFSPIYIALSMMLVTLVSTIFVRIYLYFLCSWFNYGYYYFSFSEIKRLLPAAISFMSFPLVNAVNMQGILIIIGTMLSTQAVVVFNTTRSLFNIIKQLINTYNYSILSELSFAFGNGNIQYIRRIYKITIQLYLISCIVFVIGILGFGEELYVVWTKNQIKVNTVFFYGFLISTILSCLWQNGWIILISSNKHTKLAIINFFASMLSLIFACAFIKTIGLMAIVLGFIMMDSILIVFITKSILRILNESSYSFFRYTFST